MDDSDLLAWAKARTWFYEFELPDGTTTKVDIPPEVRKIHTTRERYLEELIATRVADAKGLCALDVASHEGYFSTVLARHFLRVEGVEPRAESAESAAKMAELLDLRNVHVRRGRVEELSPDEHAADFVLMFGLLYHVQDPVGILSHVTNLTRKYLCVETQVLSFDVSGRVEDGHFLWMRPIEGLFGLVPDYPNDREGGSTAFAMVPTTRGLVWLLKELGFRSVDVVHPRQDDYEQFWRGQRIIVFAEK